MLSVRSHRDCLARLRRRSPLRAVAVFFALLAVVSDSGVRAQVAVPAEVQASLLLKVMAFDRGLPDRSPKSTRVLVVYKPSANGSEAFALQLQQWLTERQAQVAGKPLVTETHAFNGAEALEAALEAKHPAVLFLTSGFEPAEVRMFAAALEGKSVLSAGADPAYVEGGVVLGFDLISGKPKLLVNLGQARRQSVDFDAGFLSMAKVIP